MQVNGERMAATEEAIERRLLLFSGVCWMVVVELIGLVWRLGWVGELERVK